MITDYINTKAVSKMSFVEFKDVVNNNISIARVIGEHKQTIKEAFITCGGTIKKVEKKATYKKYKPKSNEVKSIED
jgi:hypothetical protein